MEREILDIIVEKLHQIPQLDIQIMEEPGKVNGLAVDAVLRIGRGSVYQKDWYVEVRKELTPMAVTRLLSQLKGIGPLMLCAEYITPGAKQVLQQEHIAYADAAGNICLEDDNLFLYIETNKTERTYPAFQHRAFTKTGLKVLFLLLQHPDYVNETYRFIAEKADAGLDTINKVFKALQKEKYILPLNEKKYKWAKREELLQHWVNAYQRTLKPKLQQRRFRALAKNKNWKDIVLPEDTYWGGANAGDLLTAYLIADTWTVYTGQDPRKLVKELQWIPDPDGDIIVIEKFWKQEDGQQHVLPLIAYADLMAEDDPRYLETAQRIYETHLQHLL